MNSIQNCSYLILHSRYKCQLNIFCIVRCLKTYIIMPLNRKPPYERNPDFTGSSANMIF